MGESSNGVKIQSSGCPEMKLHQKPQHQEGQHWSQALVAHACDLSSSGHRDQEDHSSKPAWANSSMRPCFEKTVHQKGLAEWLKV
jgi:hypothetical protein